MKKNTKVFILLGVLALLFVAGLGTNLFSSKSQKNVSTFDRKDSWVGTMDNLMSGFYPKLSPERLVPADPKCQVGGGAYLLDTERECKFFIKRLDGEDYQTATLKVDRKARVRVAIYNKKDLEDEKKCTGLDSNSLEFLVAYHPFEESKEQPECWMTQEPNTDESNDTEVRLVVREKGGSLSLSCPSCDKSKERIIEFEITK